MDGVYLVELPEGSHIALVTLAGDLRLVWLRTGETFSWEDSRKNLIAKAKDWMESNSGMLKDKVDGSATPLDPANLLDYKIEGYQYLETWTTEDTIQEVKSAKSQK